jgi:hypothetical protein
MAARVTAHRILGTLALCCVLAAAQVGNGRPGADTGGQQNQSPGAILADGASSENSSSAGQDVTLPTRTDALMSGEFGWG